MTDTFPKPSVDQDRSGIIRMEGEDALTGILAGVKAAEIVRRCNAHDAMLAALVKAQPYIKNAGAETLLIQVRAAITAAKS